MNKIIPKLLLTGDKFMSELHSKQPGFTYSTWRPFPEDREEFKNLGKQVI